MNLRQARLAKGLTQQQVAAHIGINQNTYSYWETGRSRVDTAALPRLAALFGVSVDYLLGNAGEETPKGVKIPVLGRVAAGIPIEAVEHGTPHAGRRYYYLQKAGRRRNRGRSRRIGKWRRRYCQKNQKDVGRIVSASDQSRL